MKNIVLAGGCFWGVQEYFSRINGIVETKTGYANGKKSKPTYEEVCGGMYRHAEAVLVTYDEKVISLSNILAKYWEIIDPTLINRQGNDRGIQYRTGIYYENDEDLSVIAMSIVAEQEKYDDKIETEVKPLENFDLAEEYHQDYLKKNPNGYCHIKLD